MNPNFNYIFIKHYNSQERNGLHAIIHLQISHRLIRPWRKGVRQNLPPAAPPAGLSACGPFGQILPKAKSGMKRMLICLSLAAIISLSGCGYPSNPQAETEAVAVAEDWLALVDGGNYTKSWKEAAEIFKNTVPKDQWIQMMQSLRKPFGMTLSRELTSKRYRTDLPGAPDGEYVVLQFKTSFENKKSAVETVTPMFDKDGQWRVSGYFIK